MTKYACLTFIENSPLNQMNAWRKTACLGVFAASAVLSGSCDPPQDDAGSSPDAAAPLKVVAVNEPLAYFARRIGGPLVTAECPAPGDGDPAFWKPRDEDLAAIQQAGLILLNGAGYARWIDGASLPESRMVDTSASFHARLISTEDGATHQHGPEGEHVHGILAFTIWLDFDLARRQADAVRDAIAKQPGIESEALIAGHASLTDDLQSLDGGFRDWARSFQGVPLLGSHPVYQYFARAYELDLQSQHWEPDTVPDAEGWKALSAILEDHPAEWMLWEGEPLPETRKRLAELGVACVVLDPCGAPPAEGNFLSVMKANLKALQAMKAGG